MTASRWLILCSCFGIGCSGIADLGGPIRPPGGRSGGAAGGTQADAGGTAGGETSAGGTGSGGAPNGGAGPGGTAAGSGGTLPAAGGAGDGGASTGGVGSGGAPDSGGTAGAGGGASCSDDVRNGDETGVDCGGSCVPCALGGPCGTSADCNPTDPGCASGGCVCDAVSSVCVPSHCADHRHDADETDVDCGGSCAGCGPGSLCRTDADCGGVAVGCGDQCFCDTAAATCVYNDCYDHKKDALETDFDCGGPLCHPCDLGATCAEDADCISAACDAVTHLCVAEQCKDHRIDGQESDVDCGGAACNSCALGSICHTNLDCPSAHICNANKVCQ